MKSKESQQEIAKKSDADLAETIKQLRKEHFDLRAAAVTEKIEKPSEFTRIKREIARALTEQNRRAAVATDA
ncbi:MAG: 50S ribosomal protein L29 [Planctomycetota bacterium]